MVIIMKLQHTATGIYWSKPYCNVSHCYDCPKPFQITIRFFNDNDAEIYMLNLDSQTNPNTFTAIKTFRGNREDVFKKGKEWVETLNPLLWKGNKK